jgi:hypothetical protein
MHLAEVILMAREDGFTHIQIGEGRLSLKSLPRAFSGGGEYLYRFAPEPHLCLLTPFGNQLYPLMTLQPLLRTAAQVEEQQHQGTKEAQVTRIVIPGYVPQEDSEEDSAEEKPRTLTYIGKGGNWKQIPWMLD